MKKRLTFYLLLLLVTVFSVAQTKVQNTLTEHLANPIGIETTHNQG